MIYGVYVRNRMKDKWHLFSITTSAEKAEQEIKNAIAASKKSGFNNPQVTIKIFETAFYIPEYIKELKPQTVIYN